MLIAFEYGDVQAVFFNPIALGEQFPGPVNGLLFEVITERPVAEHLEHGVVIGVHSDLFKIIVFAAHAETFLGVRHTRRLGWAVAQEDVFERVHSRIGEHQGGVILEDHRGGRHDFVRFFPEEVEECLADSDSVHGSCSGALFTRSCWW